MKFSFHNSYLENGVQFGYPGFYATYFVAAWAGFNCFRTWMRNQTMVNATFLVLAIMVIIRSNTEAELAMELSSSTVLLFIGAARKEKLIPKAAQSSPAPQFTPAYAAQGYGR